MKKLLTLALVIMLFACEEKKIDPDNLIAGKWKLISYCKPSETTICNEILIPASKGVYVEFSKKGGFNESYKNTIPVEYAFLGCGGGGYEIENGNLRIRALCMSSSNGTLIKIKSLTDKELILIPFGTGEYIFERR